MKETKYVVGFEECENHAGVLKAVLYSVADDGTLTKINVWKKGFDTPKLTLADVPSRVVELFKAAYGNLAEK